MAAMTKVLQEPCTVSAEAKSVCHRSPAKGGRALISSCCPREPRCRAARPLFGVAAQWFVMQPLSTLFLAGRNTPVVSHHGCTQVARILYTIRQSRGAQASPPRMHQTV
jgi:hypothetical protein